MSNEENVEIEEWDVKEDLYSLLFDAKKRIDESKTAEELKAATRDYDVLYKLYLEEAKLGNAYISEEARLQIEKDKKKVEFIEWAVSTGLWAAFSGTIIYLQSKDVYIRDRLVPDLAQRFTKIFKR